LISKFENTIRLIRIVAVFELLFYSYVLIDRIELFKYLINLGELRGLFDIEYEYGWNIIYCIVLGLSTLYSFYKLNKYIWIVKKIGLLCLFFSLGLFKPYVAITILALFIFHFITPVATQFSIKKNERKKYLLLIIVISLVVYVGSLFVDFLDIVG